MTKDETVKDRRSLLLTEHIHYWMHGQQGAYRTHALHCQAILNADVEGDQLVWRPASKAALRRALATKEETQATEGDVELAMRQARSQQLVARDSDWGRIVLTAPSEEVA